MYRNSNKWQRKCLIFSSLFLIITNTHAATIPWSGTADYTATSLTTDGDEDIVGPFDAYDFSNGGAVLIKQTKNLDGNNNQFTVGEEFTGYYISYVTRHTLLGSTVPNPNLNTTGNGLGYELTVAATFTERVSSVDSLNNAYFTLISGQADIYFDTAPNFNFASDAGFDDGESILSGQVIGGGGSFLPFFGAGFGSMELKIGPFTYNTDVFDPDTISNADNIFTLKINEAPGSVPDTIRTGSNSVLGNAVQLEDTLLEADGNMNLTTVPLPASLWLLLSAMLGLTYYQRRVGVSKARSHIAD